ncbi:MAG TPA: 16S rRNA (guanine(527)-N(7))-methyltransferase RsmG [Spirochaetota bacterium]|nr:16S rRNA (guanine(527)-N(7))-methyltransferase RsmG [Spirochaetota bacterium]HOM37666.1 16S rRNA (guanine(527)-N(7))-methyltransferase RsmG [Spirochaetota bacterium]HPQ49624.1 16S rRNA (guanine(527)-N(7))-methyltransferase RsmG [Spirochaetota bacterium]
MFSEKGIETLKNGLKILGIEPEDNTIDKFNILFEFYSYWNNNINLSSIEDEDSFIKKHILDSASGIKFINGKKVADLGSGAGFPGVIIKLLKPEIEVSLIESVSKKVKYLNDLSNILKIDFKVYNPTVEKIKNDFDIVTTRAFGSLSKIYKTAKLYTNKKIIAYKGRYNKIIDEIKELSGVLNKNKIKIENVLVPFTDFERHIVILDLE